MPSLRALPSTALVLAAALAGGILNTSAPVQAATACAVKSLTLAPTSVTGGTRLAATVGVSCRAPRAGLTVTISGSGPVAVPRTEKIAAGRRTVSFSIRTRRVSSPETVLITAMLGISQRTASATLSPIKPSPSIQLAPASLRWNGVGNCYNERQSYEQMVWTCDGYVSGTALLKNGDGHCYKAVGQLAVGFFDKPTPIWFKDAGSFRTVLCGRSDSAVVRGPGVSITVPLPSSLVGGGGVTKITRVS